MRIFKEVQKQMLYRTHVLPQDYLHTKNEKDLPCIEEEQTLTRFLQQRKSL